MAQDVQFDLKGLVLSNSTFGPNEIKKIQDMVAVDFSGYRLLREAVDELQHQEGRSPATSLRLGVCYYLLGRYAPAIKALKEGDGGALAQFYLGKTYFALGDYRAAIE